MNLTPAEQAALDGLTEPRRVVMPDLANYPAERLNLIANAIEGVQRMPLTTRYAVAAAVIDALDKETR